MILITATTTTTTTTTNKALEVIKKLKSVMPIARANILIRIICDESGNNNNNKI